jgi:hypothetical protein
MDDNWEMEAEEYWEKMEADIAKMSPYQQIEARDYQFNKAEICAIESALSEDYKDNKKEITPENILSELDILVGGKKFKKTKENLPEI